MGENLQDLGVGKEFLDLTPKAQPIKGKSDKLGIIKSKGFCFVKDLIKRMKRQATACRKYLEITYLTVVSNVKALCGGGIYKELSKLNTNINIPIRK